MRRYKQSDVIKWPCCNGTIIFSYCAVETTLCWHWKSQDEVDQKDEAHEVQRTSTRQDHICCRAVAGGHMWQCLAPSRWSLAQCLACRSCSALFTIPS